MKYHLKTLGCAKNTVDSWRMESALRASGHIPSFNRQDADLLLVNTCGFIDDASEESLNVIRDLDSSRAEDQRRICGPYRPRNGAEFNRTNI